MTFRPRGPRVTFTAFATVSTPFCSFFFTSSPKITCLAIAENLVCKEHSKNTVLSDNEVVVLINLYFVLSVFRKDNSITDFSIKWKTLFTVLVPFTWTNRNYNTLFWFIFLGGIRNNYAWRRYCTKLLFSERSDNDLVS